jgi:S1-C subfamily serine protease
MPTEAFSLTTFSTALADLVERASPFVVSVHGRPRRPSSGLVFASELVVTADHTLERDDQLSVQAGDARYPAILAGRDAATDIAVLRVAGLKTEEPQRSDAVRVGALVVSLSRTGSGGVSAGVGVISAVGGPLRTGRGIALPQVIRTDAAARPGTSGGAIVDTAGRVLGMTTSALLRGFPVAIPSASLWEIAGALAANQGVKRGYLGVGIQPVRLPERQRGGRGERGVLIMSLAPEGAADRAGLLVGDIVVGFNERPIGDADDLQDALAAAAPDASAALDVLRGGALQRVAVVVGERPRE